MKIRAESWHYDWWRSTLTSIKIDEKISLWSYVLRVLYSTTILLLFNLIILAVILGVAFGLFLCGVIGFKNKKDGWDIVDNPAPFRWGSWDIPRWMVFTPIVSIVLLLPVINSGLSSLFSFDFFSHPFTSIIHFIGLALLVIWILVLCVKGIDRLVEYNYEKKAAKRDRTESDVMPKTHSRFTRALISLWRTINPIIEFEYDEDEESPQNEQST